MARPANAVPAAAVSDVADVLRQHVAVDVGVDRRLVLVAEVRSRGAPAVETAALAPGRRADTADTVEKACRAME